MREIIIESPTYGTHTVLVDDEDYDRVCEYKWYVAKEKKTFYARANNYLGKISDKYVTTTIKMHRLIMNAPKGSQVDHIDHNGLNNQKHNLRICNNQKNNFNQTKRKNTTSKYKGVFLYRNGSWDAGLTLDGKRIFLGRFDKEEDAAHQYDYFAIKYFGEFANLNFPDFDYSTYEPPTVSDSKKKQASIYNGVSLHKQSGLWYAHVVVNKKNVSLKYHKTPEEAALAYNNYVIKHNLNRKLNIIEGDNGSQENN